LTDAQKTPISRTLPAFTKQKSLEEIAQLGLAIPGVIVSVAGAIVTVNLQVKGLTLPTVQQMPLASPEYIRLPIQPGDKGLAVPASFYLGGISGLGGGVADDTQCGNLATLYWVPIGSTRFSSVDPNAVTVYGPNGVVLRDSESQTIFSLMPSGIQASSEGSFSFTAGGHTLLINSAGISLDGILFALHTHGGVTVGGGVTGPVVP
jgi:hypothetical protein